uniref:Uncharacterized protein n=1 Tax=Arundo donax TaxID=35708 RepID=A0A0A9A4I5_ARUDO
MSRCGPRLNSTVRCRNDSNWSNTKRLSKYQGTSSSTNTVMGSKHSLDVW